MEFLVIQVNSNTLDIHGKKAYINSLYEKRDFVVKPGFIDKFSKAIGFISGSDYTPEDLLVENLDTYFEGETFMEFYIPKEGTIAQETSNGAISISHEDLAIKWTKFLMKIFPELRVNLIEKKKVSSREAFIASTVFKSIEEYPVTIDLSIESPLTNEEILVLRSLFLNLNYNLTYRVLEYECDVCSDRDSSNPIHIEIETTKGDGLNDDRMEDAVLLIHNCGLRN